MHFLCRSNSSPIHFYCTGRATLRSANDLAPRWHHLSIIVRRTNQNISHVQMSRHDSSCHWLAPVPLHGAGRKEKRAVGMSSSSPGCRSGGWSRPSPAAAPCAIVSCFAQSPAKTRIRQNRSSSRMPRSGLEIVPTVRRGLASPAAEGAKALHRSIGRTLCRADTVPPPKEQGLSGASKGRSVSRMCIQYSSSASFLLSTIRSYLTTLHKQCDKFETATLLSRCSSSSVLGAHRL